MNKYYSDEKNIQILLALLKAHGIKYVVASPGNTNLTLVASLQQDKFFTIYSSVDERSAAYMACGISAETEEPVMLTCTGATASRNYMSGLTEAYYRKLPILAVTSCRCSSEIGQLVPQVIDRRTLPKDIARLSVQLPVVKDDQDEWECNLKINQAILELNRNGGGPVHINIPTTYCTTYQTKELPQQRIINRYYCDDSLPSLDGKKIAIFVGAHNSWNKVLTELVDVFCEQYNSVVICDHTSGYHGKYRIQYALIGGQEQFIHDLNKMDILIHLGQISGDYFSSIGKFATTEVWRVCADGELCDTFRKLKNVFAMKEEQFFSYYTKRNQHNNNSTNYYEECKQIYNSLLTELRNSEEKIPFSNIWIASQLSGNIPLNSEIHFSILSSLRSWNFFELPETVKSFCNVGGFGIDGCMSSLVGASFINPKKLYFGIIGDLAFFYDLNSIGNRHIRNNVRILLINNGIGAEFKLYCYPGAKLGDEGSSFIAAEGHFGNKSPLLVRHYAQDLGFLYQSATTKEEFLAIHKRFISPELTNKPMLMEVFTTHEDESKALEVVRNLESNFLGKLKKKAKDLMGEDTKQTLRKILKQ